MTRLAKRELCNLVAKWADRLGLGGWSFELEVVRLERKPAVGRGWWKRCRAAQSAADSAYLTAAIAVDETNWRLSSPGEKDHMVKHEIVHVRLSLVRAIMENVPKERREPYSKWLRAANEEVTEGLARALTGAPAKERVRIG